MKRNRTKVWESLVLETPEPKVTPEELWQETGGVTDSLKVILSGFKYTQDVDYLNVQIKIILNGWIYESDGESDCMYGQADLIKTVPASEVSLKGFTLFPPQQVRLEKVCKEIEYDDVFSGIQLVNSSGESILEIGTIHYDDWYSTDFVAWHPENLPINK